MVFKEKLKILSASKNMEQLKIPFIADLNTNGAGSLGSILVVSYKDKYMFISWTRNLVLGIYPTETKIFSYKSLYMSALATLFISTPKLDNPNILQLLTEDRLWNVCIMEYYTASERI